MPSIKFVHPDAVVTATNRSPGAEIAETIPTGVTSRRYLAGSPDVPSVSEITFPAGTGPAPHAHGASELFFVLAWRVPLREQCLSGGKCDLRSGLHPL